MTEKSREELKNAFTNGKIVTKDDFADFIESTLNIKDDIKDLPSGENSSLKITSKLGINAALTITRNGNVGIGVNNPTIKLAIGDSDTGLHQQGDGELAVFTNNFERIRIKANGNVGMGTTSPSAKLSINGGLHVGGDSDPGDNNLLVDGTTITYQLSVTGELRFPQAPNVEQKIDLWGKDYGIGIQRATQYFRTARHFAWYQGGSHIDELINPGDGGIALMVIRNGNVGIGETNPQAKLHVNGNLRIGSTTISEQELQQLKNLLANPTP